MEQFLLWARAWGFVIAVSGLAFSVFNFVFGKLVANKITNNDLKHLTKDVENLKQDSKEYKTELKKDLEKIFRRLGKIDKNITRRDAICEERHSKKQR